jgi:hypothetical protein
MEWHTKLTDLKRTLHHCTVYRFPALKRLAEMRRNWHTRTDKATLATEPLAPAQ